MKNKFEITILILLISGVCFNSIGQRNTSYGTDAGYSGMENASFGYRAGDTVAGNYNNSIGSFAGQALTTGSYNTFSGYYTGVFTTTATWNTFVGAKAGANNSTGSTNLFVGGHAGYSNTTSNHNVYLGYAAGFNSKGSDNVFIGYCSGYNETGSNKLYIANSSSNTLISGDFVERKVGINTTDLSHGQLEIKPYTADANHGISLYMGTGSTAQTYLKSDGSGDFNWYITRTGDDLKGITITKSGFIGIGVTSPKGTFQIGDRWTFHNGGSKVIGYNFYNDGSDKRILQDESEAIYFGADGTMIFRVAPSGTAGSSITWTDGLYISNSGKVGVKTTSFGDADFAVNGKILATEIEVQEYPWSDYVFESDYELMSLNDLKDYIKTYKHLPNVPSGKEIEEEGLNLGEMDAILLRKIEELTLYMIALKKENDYLKIKIQDLIKK